MSVDTGADVRLYLDHVKVVVDKATEEVLKKLAYRIVERAQLNIRGNDQIDTGFMVNSIYPIFEGGSGYGEARSAAESQTHSQKTGRTVDHAGDMAPEVQLIKDADAAVVVGANYAIYQESANPFLWPAAETAAKEFGGEATRVYKENMPEEGPKR
jgi:hypothetical protein